MCLKYIKLYSLPLSSQVASINKKEVWMLDNEFLRSLGIKETLLPENNAIGDLPVAGEFMVPPEIWELSEEKLKRFILDNYTEDNPYKYRTPHGHIIAIYPYSGEGRYDIEFTVDELLDMLRLMRDIEAKPGAYQPHGGVWVPW
jgi:hypothetical protein